MTQTLSHWAWGYADRFPDAKARRSLAQLVEATLNIPDLAPREPVPLDAIELPASRLTVPTSLNDILTVDREARIFHTYGRAFPDLVRGFEGDFTAAPDAVASPVSEEDVVRLLRYAAREKIPLIPRGGGTSVVGGVEGRGLRRPFIVVSLRKMAKLLNVDDDSLLARVEAGATGPEFESQLRDHGLTFRHYPQSYEFSTVGGWVATRAGGHFATGYTRIDDFVASTRMVTEAGVFETRTLPGSGAGPSPDRLVIGSEGILGVITEATLRVHRPPTERSSATFLFDSFDTAVAATRALAQSRLFPANCRLLDAQEAMINQVVFDGSSVLIVAFESPGEPTVPDIERAAEICEHFGGRCPEGLVHRSTGTSDESEAAGQWKQAFFDGPYRQNVLLSLGAVVDTFETACPWSAFFAMHADIVSTVRGVIAEQCGAGSISCRFTHVYPDGPAPYYTFIAQGDPGRQIEQWRAIKTAGSEAILRHGGTITHHHAVGRNHRPWYDRERPDLFAAALRATKRCFDSHGLLNPGVLIDSLDD